MQQTPAIDPGVEPCAERELPDGFVDPPAYYVDSANEMRLLPMLREAAQTRNPYEILARSAEAFFRAQNPTGGPPVPINFDELGNALADLAVTGRRSYCLLATPPLTPLHDLQVAGAGAHIDLGTSPYTASQLEAKVGELLAPRVSALGVFATPAQSGRAVNTALDRAFRTAWAIRGPLAERAATREALDWIAVSGEDDMPHRPTNVPAPPFEQYEIPVSVPATSSHSALTLQTRFIIASPLVPASPPTSHTLRELPTLPKPEVPAGDNVILFLHGHMSGAEEALRLIPHIHTAGLRLGAKFSIISVDLPNCGYSESFDHEKVAASSKTMWPSGPLDREPIRTPALDFIEDFVIAFVEALDDITAFTDRLRAVIGGSLGGNLGLRLGRRSPMPPWLDKAIVSWSPASVWAPMVNDHLKSIAPGRAQKNWEASEFEDSRRNYFHEVYEKVLDRTFLPFTQPETWYRSGWSCKTLQIRASRKARREVYSSNFRKWHWRIGGEQLIYSHFDREDRWDNTSPVRYTKNVVKHLLIAGADDNFKGTNIYDSTRALADAMTTTPGTSLFLTNTGHSVYAERPRFLANEIVNFLPFTGTPAQEPTRVLTLEITRIHRERPRSGRLLGVCGTNHTDRGQFALTVEECVKFIDFGCVVFVRRADGGRTPVHVVRPPRRMPFIATAPDTTEDNNLLKLPICESHVGLPSTVDGRAATQISPYPVSLTPAEHFVRATDAGTGDPLPSGTVVVYDNRGSQALRVALGSSFEFGFAPRELTGVDPDTDRPSTEQVWPVVEVVDLPPPYGVVTVDIGRGV
jgi:pimeloyl-ACP methyl ester carboxylesterase